MMGDDWDTVAASRYEFASPIGWIGVPADPVLPAMEEHCSTSQIRGGSGQFGPSEPPGAHRGARGVVESE
jgi:hypothetical protein